MKICRHEERIRLGKGSLIYEKRCALGEERTSKKEVQRGRGNSMIRRGVRLEKKMALGESWKFEELKIWQL